MTLTISAGVATDVGRVRAVNEDSSCVRPRLYAVADGMGGHAAGDRASQIAVETLAALADRGPFDLTAIHGALDDANAQMVEESADLEGPRGMGTTLAGLALVDVDGVDRWAVFNIGDSRVYLFADGELVQLTVDHSEVQEMIAAGRLDPADAGRYPRRNVVTRSLGIRGVESADTWLLPVAADQLFVICSDGLTGEIDDRAIASRLTSAASPDEIAHLLVSDAVAAGGSDNVTVVVVRTGSDPEATEDTTPRLDVSELRDDIREDQS